MLLAIDVGNTNIVLGVFDGEKLVSSSRLSTNIIETEMEYAVKLKALFELHGITEIDGAVMSSVVPSLVRTLKRAIKLVCGVETLVVGPGVKTGLDIKIDNPAELGADIVAGGVAAIKKYPLPAIVFDFGTATTASVFDENGTCLGCSIMCGVKTAIRSLASGTSLLHDIDITPPQNIIGKNTIDSMKSGSVIGNAAMLEGMVARFEKELGEKATVIVTGGIGSSIAKNCSIDIIVDDNLLLEGLRIIYDKNK